MSASRRGFIKHASSLLLGASASAGFGKLLTGCSDDAAAGDDAQTSRDVRGRDDAGQSSNGDETEATMSEQLIASTRYGKVRGRNVDGVKVFKGIAYGADTGGDARFLPAQPPKPWTDVRDAFDYGASAPQTDPDAMPMDSAVTALIGNLNEQPESEDCLVLNVFTSSLSKSAKRPVMFWIHGGGFQAGTGSSPGYDGSNLVKRGDVVVVSINHRLNIFGFLYLGAADDEAHRTGNAGMLDIVLALRWVRENIEQFGGDPDCVTIFGESGGGRKVGTLLAMPEAKGLFQRAIIESGPSWRSVTREDAERARDAVYEQLKLTPGDLPALRKLSTQELLRAYIAGTRKYAWNHVTTGFAPVVDGEVLPAHPFDPDASPVMPDVPVIAGTNRTEMTLQLAADQAAFELDAAGLEQRAKALLGDKASDVLRVYQEAEPDASPSELYFLMISDNRYCAPMMKIAERRAALGGAPVYFYYFRWETPVADGKLHSPHALEIGFVFDNTEISKRLTGGGERAATLAAKLSSAWIEFAKTGKPSADGLPEWTAYDAEQHATLVINDESEMVDDPTRERRLAMQAVLGL